VVKTELKEFSQNLKAFPFKINGQPPNPFITGTYVKMPM
jgi:hypothetical protein